MAEETRGRYKIIFRGELVAAMSQEEVAENLRRRFKFGEAALARLFSGHVAVLKSHLDKSTAERYARVLWQAGARCRIELEDSAAPIEPLALEAESRAPSAVMHCPKCGTEQPEAVSCLACGVVVEKYRQRQEDVALTGWGGQATPVLAGAGEGEMLSGRVTSALAGTKPWVQFLAVLMFIGSGLGLLGSCLFLLIGRRYGLPVSRMNLLLQVPLLLLYLVPAYFLFQYGIAIGSFLERERVAELERALERQKSFWKFVGILAAVMTAISLLGIGAAIVVPLLARGQ
jgi:hypothetical protein